MTTQGMDFRRFFNPRPCLPLPGLCLGVLALGIVSGLARAQAPNPVLPPAPVPAPAGPFGPPAPAPSFGPPAPAPGLAAPFSTTSGQPPSTPGLTGPMPPAAPSPSTPSDLELVERLLAARRDYQVSLEQLRRYYLTAGDVERAHWAEEELRQFHRILKQAYRLELDVPPPTLQAAYNIPEANELYRQALTYKDRGWGDSYIDNQRRAEILFQQILTSYPQSDKIDDAAFQLGDIYESKAYKQYRRAALYYERVSQWNPNTQYDSRLRAARLYDKQLNERGKAIELYREVKNRETDPKALQEATKRLTELAGNK